MFQQHGQFVSCDLITPDAAAAVAFYTAVIGWTAQDVGQLDQAYTLLHAGPVAVARIVEPSGLTQAGEAQTGWSGLIGCDDVDQVCARLQEAGGMLLRPAEDLPGFGRLAIAADPQGAPFTLFGALHDQPPSAHGRALPGQISWHELQATDPDLAFPFYAALFGWIKADAIDLGVLGLYQTFATSPVPGSALAGGMMTNMDQNAPATWVHYINVENVTATTLSVQDAGGQVVQGPDPVPGDSWIARCLDPQGIAFSVIGRFG